MTSLWTALTLIVLSLIQVHAVPGTSCTTSAQCSVGECCATNSMIASKRKAVAPSDGKGILPFGFKTCQPYLTLGQSCGLFISSCGCVKGLACVQQEQQVPDQNLSSQRLVIGTSNSICVRAY